MTSRRTSLRSASRETTPAEGWGNRLRTRSSMSPTKVDRGSVNRSVAPSVTGSDAGSNDSYTRRGGSPSKSRKARSGALGNTYGTGVAAQSSQMSPGGILDLTAAMSSELRVQNLIQRSDSQRLYDDPNELNPERPVGPGVPAFPGQILDSVYEESEHLDSSKSYGPLHEYGLGHAGRRNKSFSNDHEAGIGDLARNSPSPRASPELLGVSRGIRALIWYKQHQLIILLGLLLAMFGTLIYAFGPFVLEQVKQIPLPTTTVTVDRTWTRNLGELPSATVTQIVETVVVNHPRIKERRNFFNVEIGARVDERLTSSTLAPKLGWTDSILAPVAAFWSLSPHPDAKPAITALQPWTETGQCWCASNSDLGGGQAQLAVHLPLVIRPNSITLEHQPHHLSLDPKNSARHVELWVEVDDSSTWDGHQAPFCTAKPAELLGDKWRCLAQVEFQKFDTLEKVQRIDINNPHLHTKHVVVRVLENWGREHTCIYRVQLHGEIIEKGMVDDAIMGFDYASWGRGL